MVQKRDQTHSRRKLFELYDIYLFIEYLLTRSQETAISPYLEPAEPVCSFPFYLSKIHFAIF
jgi:hypothetical protein